MRTKRHFGVSSLLAAAQIPIEQDASDKMPQRGQGTGHFDVNPGRERLMNLCMYPQARDLTGIGMFLALIGRRLHQT